MTIVSDSPVLSQEPPVTRLAGRPAIGESCLIKAIARKRHTWLHGKKITEWVTNPFAEKPFTAMYIGFRVLRGGETTYGQADEWGRSEELPTFEVKRSYYVWLFVKDERSAPFYVFCRDVERIVGAK
jgi:hypothetical protein